MKNAKKSSDGKRDGIVLNRMYVGGYLLSNMGHEVINFFQADNGCNYIYLNATGDFAASHRGRVRDMLFVKYYAKGVFEIIGMACGLKDVYKPSNDKCSKNANTLSQQEDFIKQEGGISYGGKCITEIFKNNKQQSIFITYKADAVYRPANGNRIFICFKGVEDFDGQDTAADTLQAKTSLKKTQKIIVSLCDTQQAQTSLKQYIFPNKSQGDYNAVKRLLDNETLWIKYEEKVPTDIDKLKLAVSQQTISLFDICRINDSESAFSNTLAFFLERYPKLWVDFFKSMDVELDCGFSVSTEENASIPNSELPTGGRIDIMIRSKKCWIVIENKIKSDINTKKSDEKAGCTQLDRYYNYVTSIKKMQENSDEIKLFFFVLSPNYKNINLNDPYKHLKYGDIYKFLSGRTELNEDANFNAFFNAMKRHVYDNANDYLYEEMQIKFFKQIIQNTKTK